MDFPSTQWSLLAQASLHGDTAAQLSLETFCQRYRAPVMALLRRRGVLESRVEDLTHDFFLQLFKSSALKRADPNLGSFRNFIGGALTHFLADDLDRNAAAKRGGGVTPLSLDAGDGVAQNIPIQDPDITLQLDREWALHLVSRALETVRRRWAQLDKSARYTVLRNFLPGAMKAMSPDEAAKELGVSSDALRQELHRLREGFRAAIRAEVSDYASSPAEVEEEMRHLARVLQAGPNDSEETVSQPASIS